MRLTIPLGSGTALANVRYRWIVGGVEGPQLSAGISQPDVNFAFFEFNVTPPDGAEEIIAYDVTDLSNWNVGQYILQKLNANVQAVTPSGSPVAVTGVVLTAASVTFRSVYESIVRRLGYNPRGDQVKEDLARNILSKINRRVKYVWGLWDWPQINAVEWRAFRTIWTSTRAFSIDDEIYYFGDGVTPTAATEEPPEAGANAGYYKATNNAPAGTLPTDTNFFEPLELTDRYIAYEQSYQNAIGEVLNIYPSNPRTTNNRTRIYRFSPSSKGISVAGSGEIVWLRYRIPPSQFTLDPFMTGRTVIGSKFYDPVTGECYTYTGEIVGPIPAHAGTLIPFPMFAAAYVEPAAYADCLSDTARPAATKLQDIQLAHEEALQFLQREIDNLAQQGQVLRYFGFRRRRSYYSVSVADSAVPIFDN